jgi:SNF2 family DNA or RNA helicase
MHRALWDRHRLNNLITHPNLFYQKMRKYRDKCKLDLVRLENAFEEGEAAGAELAVARAHYASLTKLLATVEPKGSVASASPRARNTYLTCESAHSDIKGVQASGKMTVLMELLRQCYRRGEKVLVFSEFTTSLGTTAVRYAVCLLAAHSSSRDFVVRRHHQFVLEAGPNVR